MTAFRASLLLLTLSLLAACDESPKPVPTPPRIEPATKPAGEPSVATEAAPVLAPLVAAKPTAITTPAAPRSTAGASQVAAAKVQPVPESRVTTGKEHRQPVKPLSPSKLDLRLPAELVEQMELGEPLDSLSSQPLLPPLFVEKPVEPGPFQLNGRLITNDQSEGYWNSVEGAELQFEFRN